MLPQCGVNTATRQKIECSQTQKKSAIKKACHRKSAAVAAFAAIDERRRTQCRSDPGAAKRTRFRWPGCTSGRILSQRTPATSALPLINPGGFETVKQTAWTLQKVPVLQKSGDSTLCELRLAAVLFGRSALCVAIRAPRGDMCGIKMKASRFPATRRQPPIAAPESALQTMSRRR